MCRTRHTTKVSTQLLHLPHKVLLLANLCLSASSEAYSSLHEHKPVKPVIGSAQSELLLLLLLLIIQQHTRPKQGKRKD